LVSRSGEIHKAIQNQGAQVHGIEPSTPDGVLAGSLSGHDNISICMLSDFQTSVYYDAVVLIHTFEHMRDPVVTLQQLRTLLKPDGCLFSEVPNLFSTTGFYRKRKGLHEYPSPNRQ
jgi:2-polyprenyl-3-methyl-5-hydroxy-6-metoxy-1,4-benzoquinol methylase